MQTPIWAAGLSTRRRAKLAATAGGIACLVQAARAELGVLVMVLSSNKAIDNAIAYLIGASILPVVILIGGIELLRGVGKVSSSLSALIIVADLIVTPPSTLSLNAIVSITVKVVLLLIIANGTRGAFALRYLDYDSELRNTFD